MSEYDVNSLFRAEKSSHYLRMLRGDNLIHLSGMKYFEIHNEEVMRVPIIIYSRWISQVTQTDNWTCFKFPITRSSKFSDYKTLKSSLNYILDNYGMYDLVTVFEKNEVCCYAGNGCIFSPQMEPLLVCTLDVTKDKEDNRKYHLVKPVAMIDRKVFTTASPINNYIVKTVIRKMTEKAIDVDSILPNHLITTFSEELMFPEIVITDCMPVSKPEVPDITLTSENIISQAIDTLDRQYKQLNSTTYGNSILLQGMESSDSTAEN